MISTIAQSRNIGIGRANGGRLSHTKALFVKAKLPIIGVKPQLTAPRMRWRALLLDSRLHLQRGCNQARPAARHGRICGRPDECRRAAFATYNYHALCNSSLRVRATSVEMAPEKISGEILQDGAKASTAGFAEQVRHLSTDAKLLHETFAELELRPVQEVVGGVRTRQHVNPLKASLMAPPAPVDWNSLLSDTSLPLTVDIGCGSGRLLMVLGKRNQGVRNYLGLDVRDRLVNRANLWAEELKLHRSVRFLTANATMAFPELLATYPGPLELVSVLCPDPHFKRRHQKRKIVQKRLVDAVLHRLRSPGGQIFMQSDVKDVAMDMREQFDVHLGSSLELAGFELGIERDSEGWVMSSPLGVLSEREAHIVANGGRVYRSFYRRL